jgi:hypothetical protein
MEEVGIFYGYLVHIFCGQLVFFVVIRCNVGVVEKHDFRTIQQKIPQISDFAKNGI